MTEEDERAMACLRHYLDALIQKQRQFAFLRQVVTKASQLEQAKQLYCVYSPQDKSIHVKGEEAGAKDRAATAPEAPREKDKSFALAGIEKIQMIEVTGASGKAKFINITLKADRTPVILHAPTEIMELWYDALRLALADVAGGGKVQVETQASSQKVEVFRKAAAWANNKRPAVVEIPPPPQDFDFVAEFPPM
jgi:hypothetical protein